MKAFENLLYGLFSAESDLDDDFIAELLERTRCHEDTSERDLIKAELIDVFRDNDFDWICLLQNKRGWVADLKDNAEGKLFVIERLWRPLFPDEDPEDYF